jgi:hypothetical protein
MNTAAKSPGQQGCGLALLVGAVAVSLTLLVGLGMMIGVLRYRALRSVGGRAVEIPADDAASHDPAQRDSGPQPTPAEEVPQPVPDKRPPHSVVSTSQRLADLEPLEVTGVSLGSLPLRRPVQLGGQTRKHSLWAQPVAGEETSQISYTLAGRFTRLRGLVGLAGDRRESPAEPASPSVVFRVYGDGNLLWASEPLPLRPATQTLDVKVRDVDVLALTVECSDRHAAPECAWGDLTLDKD